MSSRSSSRPCASGGEDVLLLAHHFVRALGARIGRGEPGLSREAQELLHAYPWPGNIRELANAVERALILAEGGLLTAAHFGLDGGRRPPPAGPPEPPAAPEALAALERRAIRATLEHTQGNKTQAAALLGITRTQLHTRLKRFGQAV